MCRPGGYRFLTWREVPLPPAGAALRAPLAQPHRCVLGGGAEHSLLSPALVAVVGLALVAICAVARLACNLRPHWPQFLHELKSGSRPMLGGGARSGSGGGGAPAASSTTVELTGGELRAWTERQRAESAEARELRRAQAASGPAPGADAFDMES